MSRGRELGAGPGSHRPGQTISGFLQEIQQAGLLRSTVAASDIAAAVLGALLSTLRPEQAQEFVRTMPPTLRDLLHAYVVGQRSGGLLVGRDDVLRTVARALRMGPDDAVLVTRVVLVAAQNWLPRKELQLLRLVLAAELADLWTPPPWPERT